MGVSLWVVFVVCIFVCEGNVYACVSMCGVCLSVYVCVHVCTCVCVCVCVCASQEVWLRFCMCVFCLCARLFVRSVFINACACLRTYVYVFVVHIRVLPVCTYACVCVCVCVCVYCLVWAFPVAGLNLNNSPLGLKSKYFQ